MATARRVRSKRGPALVSSAGIMRYFEHERAKIKLHPKTVAILCILSAILITGLNLIG